MQNKKIIAIFDSGVGGLTLLKDCYNRLQGVNYLYLTDSANMPYGNKTALEIYENTKQSLQILKGYSVDALVLACNTATAICAQKFRQDRVFPFAIFGVEPAILPAVATLQALEKITYAQRNGIEVERSKPILNASISADNNSKKTVLQGAEEIDRRNLELKKVGKKNIQEQFLKKPILLLATTATMQSARVQNLFLKSGARERIY